MQHLWRRPSTYRGKAAVYGGNAHMISGGAVRNDLLVLMLMNGNDYLPKIRGGGFQQFFKAYKR
eukprot:562305-Rhodomonas_salina.1